MLENGWKKALPRVWGEVGGAGRERTGGTTYCQEHKLLSCWEDQASLLISGTKGQHTTRLHGNSCPPPLFPLTLTLPSHSCQ